MKKRKSDTFAQELDDWRPELKHKEKAEILRVPLETFHGWLYEKHSPNAFVKAAVRQLMAENAVAAQ